MTNTSWSKLQKKYSLSKNKIYSALKGKEDPEDHNTGKRENKQGNKKLLHHILVQELNKS